MTICRLGKVSVKGFRGVPEHWHPWQGRSECQSEGFPCQVVRRERVERMSAESVGRGCRYKAQHLQAGVKVWGECESGLRKIVGGCFQDWCRHRCYDPELSGTLWTTLHHQRHRVRSALDPHDILWSTRSPTELLILQFCIGSYCAGHVPNWGACYDRGNTIVGDDRPRHTTKR
jgi:hypothetical protein